MPAHLNDLLAAALAARRALLEQLHAEQTTAYRLFHGSVEGVAGLTVDRYGDALLAQSFHRPLDAAQLAAIEAFYAREFAGLPLFYNDRSQANSRIANALPPELVASAHELREFQEEYAANGDRHIELLRKKLVAARSEIDIALATQSKRIYLELREEVERELALRGGALPHQ